MSFRANYSTVLNDRMKKIYPVVSPKMVDEFSKYTTKIDWNQYQHTTTGVTGLGMGQVIADGAVPASDAPIQGFTKTFTQGIFTQRIRITKQAFYYLFQAKDAKKIDALIKAKVLSLKDSIQLLQNYYAQSILANGWATSFTFTPIGGFQGSVTVDTTGADSVAYWSASHPREDGGTAWSNIVSSGTINPVFSFTALLAARGQQADKKDGRGLPLVGTKLDTFMFQDQSTAFFLATSLKKTLESGKYPSAIPGTTGTFVDGNPTESFEVIGLTRFGSSSTGVTSIMWFGFDSAMKNEDYGFKYIESMPLDISPFMEDFSGNMDQISTATLYCQFGASDLRGFMASNGTAA